MSCAFLIGLLPNLFETEEELEALQKMSRFNVSIPELLSKEEHRMIIHDFLGMFQDTIID